MEDDGGGTQWAVFYTTAEQSLNGGVLINQHKLLHNGNYAKVRPTQLLLCGYMQRERNGRAEQQRVEYMCPRISMQVS